MDKISKIIDGKILNTIIELPKYLQNIPVEITITPVANTTIPKINRSKLRAQLQGSHTKYLTGIVKTEDINLEELRAERRTEL